GYSLGLLNLPRLPPSANHGQPLRKAGGAVKEGMRLQLRMTEWRSGYRHPRPALHWLRTIPHDGEHEVEWRAVRCHYDALRVGSFSDFLQLSVNAQHTGYTLFY